MIFGFTSFELLCNIIFYFEFCVFLHAVLTPRFRKGWMYVSYVFLIVVVLLASTLFARMSVLRILTLPLLLMIYNLIFFQDKRLRCIFVAWLIPVIIFLSEIIVVAFVYNPQMLDAALYTAPLREQILCWGVEMLSAGVLYWITSLVMNRVRNRFSLREMLMYAFFPVSQFMLLYGWINSARLLERSLEQQLLVLGVMFICLLADAGLFGSMIRVSRQVELETENRFLAAQIGAQREHYADLTAQYENIRRMRHDIAKHISAMDSLLASGRHTEAAAYVAELRTESYNPTLGICENPVVDAFLHSAIQSAAEEGLVLDVSVSVPADISIASTDLVCTYGNLLDNAVEACTGVPEAVIKLRTHVSAGYLITSAENPIGPNEGRKTRIQGLERGIGLRVLQDLAEKYDGSFRYQTDGDVFRAEITYRLDV